MASCIKSPPSKAGPTLKETQPGGGLPGRLPAASWPYFMVGMTNSAPLARYTNGW